MVEWEVEIETEICGSAADWPFHYKDGSEHTVTSYSCQFFTMVEVNIMEHHILANFREREKNWSSYEVKDHVWVNVVELMALYTDENPWFTCTKFNSKSLPCQCDMKSGRQLWSEFVQIQAILRNRSEVKRIDIFSCMHTKNCIHLFIFMQFKVLWRDLKNIFMQYRVLKREFFVTFIQN